MNLPKRKFSILLAIIAILSLILAVGGPRLLATAMATPLIGEQTASVTVGGDQAANVEIAPHDGPNGRFAERTFGTLSLTIRGLNYDAKTDVSNVFTLTNNAGEPIRISITKHDWHAVTSKPEDNPENDRVTFYIDANGNRVYDHGEKLDGRELPAMETLGVSLRIDTKDFMKGDDNDNGLPVGEEDFFDELEITATSTG